MCGTNFCFRELSVIIILTVRKKKNVVTGNYWHFVVTQWSMGCGLALISPDSPSSSAFSSSSVSSRPRDCFATLFVVFLRSYRLKPGRRIASHDSHQPFGVSDRSVVSDFCSCPFLWQFPGQIKGESKTAKKRTCWFTEHYSDEWKKVDWHWTRRIFSLSLSTISKKVINLLRHCQTEQREDDGAVQFWRITNFQSRLIFTNSLLVGWTLESMLGSRRSIKKEISVLLWYFRNNFYLRALQGHSGRNLIDPSLQDNVIIQSGFFHHIYHIGCAFNLHSIINNGLIPGGQNSRRRRKVFFLPIDPRDKGHQDHAQIDFTAPRRAQYLHSAWKKHQDAVLWVDINLAIQKGLTFYQTRSNAIILQGTPEAHCIPKVVRLKTGEVLYEKSYVSPRPPPKISLRHDHDWTRGNVQLGSAVEQQPEGKIVRQSRGEVQHAIFSQLTPNQSVIDQETW